MHTVYTSSLGRISSTETLSLLSSRTGKGRTGRIHNRSHKILLPVWLRWQRDVNKDIYRPYVPFDCDVFSKESNFKILCKETEKYFLKHRVRLAPRPVIPTTGTIVSHNGTHSFVLALPRILDKCFQFALDSWPDNDALLVVETLCFYG